jgi:hypothetical protein
MVSCDVYRLYIEILYKNGKVIKSSYNYCYISNMVFYSVWLKISHPVDVLIIHLWT